MIETAIHTFDFAVRDDDDAKPWRAFPAFRGPTRGLTDMACHASVLAGGHQPHPPHAHVEEEILIPLEDEVEVTIASDESDPTPRTERLRPGSFVYYPAWQFHTLRNPGTRPVSYLMLKWRAPANPAEGRLGPAVVRLDGRSPGDDAAAFWIERLLEGPTDSLGKLQAHLSVLAPGAGYEPHRDAYDVAIVTLAGTVETLGQPVGPGSVIYYGAGELHGMRNTGTESARYLVFEFHAPGTTPLPRHTSFHQRLRSGLVRRGRKALKPLISRIRRRPTS